MQPSHLLTILIFLPLVGAAALLVLGGEDRTWIRWSALILALSASSRPRERYPPSAFTACGVRPT